MKAIQILTEPRENFTPSELMYRYAQHTPGIQFARGYFGESRLMIAGRVYQYHHWMITAEGGRETVTLYLEEVPA